jgi:hypothetical protein
MLLRRSINFIQDFVEGIVLFASEGFGSISPLGVTVESYLINDDSSRKEILDTMTRCVEVRKTSGRVV